jgi:hypothetical protein
MNRPYGKKRREIISLAEPQGTQRKKEIDLGKKRNEKFIVLLGGLCASSEAGERKAFVFGRGNP